METKTKVMSDTYAMACANHVLHKTQMPRLGQYMTDFGTVAYRLGFNIDYKDNIDCDVALIDDDDTHVIILDSNLKPPLASTVKHRLFGLKRNAKDPNASKRRDTIGYALAVLELGKYLGITTSEAGELMQKHPELYRWCDVFITSMKLPPKTLRYVYADNMSYTQMESEFGVNDDELASQLIRCGLKI